MGLVTAGRNFLVDVVALRSVLPDLLGVDLVADGPCWYTDKLLAAKEESAFIRFEAVKAVPG